MAMRFHLDENLSPAIAGGLRARGVDVTTTPEAGLNGASDIDQLAFASREERVLVTQDTDFFTLAADAGESHEGIVFAAAGKLSIGEWVRLLALLDACCEAADIRGRIEYL